jgi:hypothetical protein
MENERSDGTESVERREPERPREALEELNRSLERVRLLMDACDVWLRDADDPNRYDLGLRADEVTVTYLDHEGEGKAGRARRKKATLQVLLKRIAPSVERQSVEPRFADPRRLILKTAQELRQTVQTAAELARMLADARALEALREALLAEIAKVDEDVAHRIAEAVRSCLLLHAAPSGAGALVARGDPR